MKIEINSEELAQLRARITQYHDQLSNLRPAFAKAAVEVLDAAQMQFNEQGDPPWAPKKKENGLPLLVRKGSLKQSLQAGFSGAVEDVDNGILVGTNIEYARYQQFGTRRIPARPFLWRDPEDLGQKIRAVFAAHISGKTT